MKLVNITRLKAQFLLGTLAVACLGSQGCAILDVTGFAPVESESVAEVKEPHGYCEVLVENGWDNGVKRTVPVSPGMHVNDVLLASKAIKAHRRIKVTLMRTDQKTGLPLKLACDYDGKEGRVPFGRDYAIMPGDKLYVVQDLSLPGEDLMKSFTGG